MTSLGLDEEEFCDECKSDFANRQYEAYHASYYDLQPEQLYGTEYDHLNTLDNEPQPYEPDPIEKAWRFMKAQMSDVHLGFQEDPEREIARLMHQGLSRQEAMGLYQQYLDSLGSGA
jgi:hypothetical protein